MTQTWQKQLQQAIKTPEDLLTYLSLDTHLSKIGRQAHQQFMTKVPLSFAKRMHKRDINDPLLKQVLPFIAEEENHPGFLSDPLQEIDFNPVPGMLHKYHGRILMTFTPQCAINCRYCFRRHFNYEENNVGTHGWKEVFAYIQQNPEIHEIILSGGDPLIASTTLLQLFTDKLSNFPQIKTLRLHTRLPIVLPARVDDAFLAWTKKQPFKLVMVMHANHPQELNHEVKDIFHALTTHQVTLLNQSVLLKGINDNAETLATLSHRLFEYNSLPYYLHQMDKVLGTHHFVVSDPKALKLHETLTQLLPGYLVPKLVREIPGHQGKTLLK